MDGALQLVDADRLDREHRVEIGADVRGSHGAGQHFRRAVRQDRGLEAARLQRR